MKDISRILIANRGEIAMRIIRTARKMGYTCTVVYTSEEKDADFVKEADEAYDLGDGNLLETYLHISKIIGIAQKNRIDAIHPGYGFLSENYLFAQACEENHITYIGPTSENIRQMSRKTEAREFVRTLGIPLLKSVEGRNSDEILKKSSELTFPVLVKAASGGGGKGMRIVSHLQELKSSLDSAQREANDLFADPTVYVEEYLMNPRHIEVQILGDASGNIVHLFDRECSIQRRHQKIIEEAPSPSLSKTLRDAILDAALRIARKMEYVSAGTVEFLLDANEKFYFLEMNTRIQVEHAVTEEITGTDLVKEQFRIAAGKPLSFKQEDIICNGHAIECRIYAENPFAGFQPSSGKIIAYHEPDLEEVRIDSSLKGPANISSSFDPMISKIIAHSPERESTRKKMLSALTNYVIHGIETNMNYLIQLLSHSDYIRNRLSTSYCSLAENQLKKSHEKKLRELSVEIITAAFLLFAFTWSVSQGLGAGVPVWQSLGYWQNVMVTELDIFGSHHSVFFKKHSDQTFTMWLDQNEPTTFHGIAEQGNITLSCKVADYKAFLSSDSKQYFITLNGVTLPFSETNRLKPAKPVAHGVNGHPMQEVVAPLTGKIVKVNIKSQDVVNKGDLLMVVESMKMENHILAPREGRIAKVLVNTGDKVTGQDVLAVLT